MVVGVTGGIGSGKSTVVKMFSEFDDVAIYIADVQAKQLMHSSKFIKEKLIAEFSEEVYQNGVLNRKFLAGIVFRDKARLKTLNSIVHPLVFNHFKNFVKANNSKSYIIYENAILFENGSERLCDKIITVTAPVDIRVNRVVQRDNCTKKDVLKRIGNQWSDEKKLMKSNYMIVNVDLSVTKSIVNSIHDSLILS